MNRMTWRGTDLLRLSWSLILFGLVSGCAGSGTPASSPAELAVLGEDYIIGPGDTLQVFVWQNPEVSATVPVRPDGKISTPLVEDMQAVGKTPTRLARDIESVLGEYIRAPTVNVIVSQFVGTFGKQIRVIGQAVSPQAIPYAENMTLLDVMIEVGGLAEGAAGNRAKIIRRIGGQEAEIDVRLNDLINRGRISANIEMRPGDVLIIPESRL